MKLPIIVSLLVASTLLQSPIVSAQIRGENPNHSSGDRRHDGGIRPNPRPAPYPDDRRRPNPAPRPRPEPRPNPTPDHGRPAPRPIPRPEPRPYPVPHPRPRPEPQPYPRPYPDYPRDNYREASVQFYSVTRSIGGEWLRVGFSYPAYIDYVMVNPYRAAVRIHEAYAVTETGRRIYLSNLTYAGVIYAGQIVSSEYISAGERIVAVDIRAESMGDYADLSVKVSSRYEYPSIYPTRY